MTDVNLLSIALGIGLAAATGFRVFIPLLALSMASREFGLELSEGFAWIASTPAFVAFATAAVLEILAYYIPGVDHMLDAVAGPAAVAAGVIASAAVMTDLPDYLKWTVAVIAGGGIAGITQGATTLTRAKSGLFTVGVGNPVVATGELVGAVGLSAFAILMPFLTAAIVIVLVIMVIRAFQRRKSQSPDPPALP
ncbi:MAG TPA: DUF4126 domain-containing protein [Steroidobacteraceae bacterium]|nr:DUF4126 domain-containing protein [Steroidobacteraceae bacterium]